MPETKPAGSPSVDERSGPLDCMLNIDKPPGMTTMDVVRRVKRASRHKRVGHGGTLDPLATGVVAVCIGQATRMMEYLIEGTREYRAVVELGAETDTYDALGRVTRKSDPSSVGLEDVKRALEAFVGETDQVPPMYSALKKHGERLYTLARAGVEVEREPRRVLVHDLEITDWSPPVVTLELTCGRGFYVRSMAHDLGNELGCGGHLKGLVRLRSGPFNVSRALTLDETERRFADGTWPEAAYAPDIVVRHMRAAIVGARVEDMISNGRALPIGVRIPGSRPDEQCRVYGLDGRFLAIMSFDAAAGQWRPERVFYPADRRR